MRMHLLLSVLPLLGLAAARAADYRMWLATQYDWTGKRGFVLDLESSNQAGPAALEKLNLTLAVGDGEQWRFASGKVPWKLGHDYTARAVISPGRAELFLDGERLAGLEGRFAPRAGRVEAFRVPDWAAGPAAFTVTQSALALSAGKRRAELSQKADKRPPALRLFEPERPQSVEWTSDAAETLTVTARFRLEPPPNLRALAPFIDRYGQAIAARYPGKVTGDADLKASVAAEAAHAKGWAPPADYDRYGGYTKSDWRETPTGFYRAVQHGGMWWLVSPTGLPVFYTGLCVVDMGGIEMTPIADREFLFAELPPRTGEYARAWGHDMWGVGDNSDYASFYAANLARKYGADWHARATEQARLRLHQWGFTGIGKWTDRCLPDAPQIAVIYPSAGADLAGHPDVFDPAARAAYKASVRELTKDRRDDPALVGWSVGNEYSEIIKRAEVTAIMEKPAATPGKRALIDHALATIYKGDASAAATAWGLAISRKDDLYDAAPKLPEADVETMRRFYEDAYYALAHGAVKEADPNHLYLGNWIVPGWWEDEADFAITARHCDVIGFDRYAPTLTDPLLDRLFAAAGKPVLCGEFGFPSYYNGARGFGRYASMSSKDDADAGAYYARWLRDAARNRFCVGVCWFEYRDQSLTGRGPGRGENLVINEHYAFGLVDVADRPKWALVDRVRAANLSAPALRRRESSVVSHPSSARTPGADREAERTD